jgi:hypothetical protein
LFKFEGWWNRFNGNLSLMKNNPQFELYFFYVEVLLWVLFLIWVFFYWFNRHNTSNNNVVITKQDYNALIAERDEKDKLSNELQQERLNLIRQFESLNQQLTDTTNKNEELMNKYQQAIEEINSHAARSDMSANNHIS